MPKSSKKESSASTRRAPARTSAPASFAIENDSEEIQDESDAIAEKGEEGNDSDDGMDIGKFMQEIQKRQAKKTSLLSAAFDNQKKALYTSARKQAKDMSREGVIYLENLKSQLLDMKKDEVSFKRYPNEVIPLWKNREVPLTALSESYQSDTNDLFVRRAKATHDASEMIRTNPAEREHNLRRFLADARQQVDQCHQKEIEATDASKLIKHYKALLHA